MNNEFFAGESIQLMSKLTRNLLHGIDYGFVERRRTENFMILHRHLAAVNKLQLSVPQGAFAYPFFIEDAAQVRNKLIDRKIYIPRLWPNVVRETTSDMLEHELAEKILPLPVDQRYTAKDMEYIVRVIQKCIAS